MEELEDFLKNFRLNFKFFVFLRDFRNRFTIAKLTQHRADIKASPEVHGKQPFCADGLEKIIDRPEIFILQAQIRRDKGNVYSAD